MAFGSIMGQTPLVETSPLDKIGLYQILGKGSGTWTPQQTGKYLVIVIGPGGDGGEGYFYPDPNRFTSGTGGGSGGIAVFKLSITNLSSYSFEINDNKSVFNNWVTCNSGSKGVEGKLKSNNNKELGGAGGTVESTIDLLFKINGAKGEDGEVQQVNRNSSSLISKGASLPFVLNFPFYYNNKSGILLGSVTNGTPFVYNNPSTGVQTFCSETPLGGCIGMGGDGAPACVYFDQERFYEFPASAKGGDGAIIIQYLGKD